MSSSSKTLSTGKTALSTGGWGAILSVAVPALFPDPNSVWHTVAYACVPGLAAFLTYLMNWAISRHGLESPEDAAKRAKCKRDLKEIEAQLQSPDLTPALKQKLLLAKEKTVEILVCIGSSNLLEMPKENGVELNADHVKQSASNEP